MWMKQRRHCVGWNTILISVPTVVGLKPERWRLLLHRITDFCLYYTENLQWLTGGYEFIRHCQKSQDCFLTHPLRNHDKNIYKNIYHDDFFHLGFPLVLLRKGWGRSALPLVSSAVALSSSSTWHFDILEYWNNDLSRLYYWCTVCWSP